MKAPIAIVGSGGFVGTWLVRELRQRGVDPIWPASPADAIDIRDEAAIARLIALMPSVIVNLAAIASPSEAEKQPVLTDAVNHRAAVRLAEMAAASGQCRLIHVGSAVAYGDSFDSFAQVPETAPLRPRGIYARSKAQADMAIGSHVGARAASLRLRPFWHAGPGQHEQYVVAAFARQVALIMRGLQDPVIRVGNLDVARDFLDVRDVARLYADLATEADPGWGEVLNVASGRSVTIRTLLEGLIARAGLPIDIQVDPGRLRPNDITSAAGDTTLLLSGVAWRPLIGIDQMLDDVLDDWLQRLGE